MDAEKTPASLKLYLDEDVNPLIAGILRDRGFQAISAHEEDHGGISDMMQLQIAAHMSAALVTHNIRDFCRIHKDLNGNHTGIILANQDPFGVLLRKLLHLLSCRSPKDCEGALVWLSQF